MIFIEMNAPLDPNNPEHDLRKQSSNPAVATLRRETRKENRTFCEPSYIFVCNDTLRCDYEDKSYSHCCVAEGFNVKDFRHDYRIKTQTQEIRRYIRHQDAYEIVNFLREQYFEVPSDFDYGVSLESVPGISHELCLGDVCEFSSPRRGKF